jgi:predicted dehydrogenase/threonine dehydrogenase-like Zn-dependent dehydrogenase
MKQILQNLGTGETEIVSAPAPSVKSGHLLIDSSVSLISSGTERMLVDFGKSGLLAKAQSQPEKVRQVFEKMSTEGIVNTIEAVRSKLGQPIPLGYSNVGTVRETMVSGFQRGDRVVSNGPHASVISVPKNLCARIPDGVSDEVASFTVVASIGLQGMRLAQPTLGETFVVTGVGLIGLLTVQMLRAHGCRVLAIDFDQSKLDLAKRFGAEVCNPGLGEDPVAAGISFSRGYGVDGVIITASTKSNDPITHAARMCRQRGRIVLVGVTGLKIDRGDFYEKELSFQVSCSYGPGRYDASYENEGNDYPIGFVRWTERRNFEAVLDMMADGSLDVSALISHRVPFDDAIKAYQILSDDTSSLGILLSYDNLGDDRHKQNLILKDVPKPSADRAVMGFIGAGNYSSRMLIPAFKKAGSILHGIASQGGTNAVIHGRKAGFSFSTSDPSELIANSDINAVAIVTRHDSHARFVIEALNAGRHVFVEKPLALTHEELENVRAAYAEGDKHLMVGFNRRFAPQVQIMKRLLGTVKVPKSFVMVMNAGAIPVDHWTQSQAVGGGRIIGEACHHIDLMRFLAGAPIVSVHARRMGDTDAETVTEDKASITLGFEDGSFGTIHYLANGGSSFPKERIEVFAAGRTLQLDNFIKLRGFNWPRFNKHKLWRQDKGQKTCAEAFVKAVEQGGAPPIPATDLFEVAQVTIEAAEMLRTQA